jgi:RNA-directed DNA polymerase
MGLREDPLPAGSGLPIGTYFSQWCGALYLDGLDHYVQRELKIPGYLRYMDDLALFADDPPRLANAALCVGSWLQRERGLALNPKRGGIRSTAAPSTFLGYRVSRAGILPGPKLKRRMRQRLAVAAQRGPTALIRSLRSYSGLLSF